MKQTSSVNECAVCAVVPRIRNAGNWPVFTGNLDDSAPHNAAKRGTNHDYTAMREGREMSSFWEMIWDNAALWIPPFSVILFFAVLYLTA